MDAIQSDIETIAKELTREIKYGRLLDIGTGPGRLLLKIHELNQKIKLYSFDISKKNDQESRENS
ncbi:MAG: hypothetical protein GF329_04595 [Candidatus Lokiarchaeota archaeon]|nr:hypothetical protein [Candidatus Lokiarchaeota archaeon]